MEIKEKYEKLYIMHINQCADVFFLFIDRFGNTLFNNIRNTIFHTARIWCSSIKSGVMSKSV